MAKITFENGVANRGKFLYDAAMEAADDYIVQRKKFGVDYGKKPGGEKAERDAMAEQYFNELSQRLSSYDLNDQKTAEALEAFKGNDYIKWMYANGNDPFTLAKNADEAKWYETIKEKDGIPAYVTMSQDELAKDAFEKGYRWYDIGERGKYLNEAAKRATAAKRADINKHLTDGVAGTVAQLVYPSATEAARKQIAEGKGEDADIYKNAALDFGAGVLTAMAPSFNVFKNPLTNTTISSLGQGFVEGGRSIGGDLLRGDDVDYGKAALSGGASAFLGATNPGFVSTGGQLVSKVPGLGSLGRGITMSVRSQDPVFLERQGVVRAVKTAARDKAENFNKLPVNKKNDALRAEASKGREYAKVLGLGDNLDPKAAGMAYDMVVEGKGGLNPGFTYETMTPEAQEAYNQFAAMFPAASGEAAELGGMAVAGKKTGKALQDIGGRVEPVIQANPASYGNSQRITEYKDQPWYQSMEPRKRQMVDLVFAAKEADKN